MKIKFSPAVVGMFVLGGLALLVFGLFSFGGINFFSKPQRFIVYFNESIHGLDLGSPVKLRGVRVGRVVKLNLRYDQQMNQSMVEVMCEFDADVITDSRGALVDVTDRAQFQELIDRGLRARLGLNSFATGMLFVGLDFLDPAEYPADNRVTDVRYAVVPAAPSQIEEFQSNLLEILNDIKRVGFAELGREVKLLLAETRKQLDGLDVRGVADQWKKTGATLEALAASPEIKDTFANLNLATKELRQTLAKLDTQITPAGENLTTTLIEAKKAMESFSATATTMRRFINAQQNLGEEANQALSKVADAADAVQRLADFLERNPNAVITGRKRPE